MFLKAEGWQRRGRYHVVRQAVPDGGSGDREGPAADGRPYRQFYGRYQQTIGPTEQSGGNVDQADRRHEPVGRSIAFFQAAWPTEKKNRNT